MKSDDNIGDERTVDEGCMERLFALAGEAAGMAYVPYSKFRVGAALLGEDGRIFTGCNVENRSYGLTICAERNAVFHAVSQGCRSFLALAIVTPDSREPVGPCGACRQVLSEFMPPRARVRFGPGGPGSRRAGDAGGNAAPGDAAPGDAGGPRVDTTLGELLPFDSLHDLAGRVNTGPGSGAGVTVP
jgi:cytidine deaminase